MQFLSILVCVNLFCLLSGFILQGPNNNLHTTADLGWCRLILLVLDNRFFVMLAHLSHMS